MNKKIKIQKVSSLSIWISMVMVFLFLFIFIWSWKQFRAVCSATEQYISCEKAAKQLQDGSDYLTEQVRLFVMTGQEKYMDLYFQEANHTMRREKALADLKKYFGGTDTFKALKAALNSSVKLMNTEYYSMRLVLEAKGVKKEKWPQEIKNTVLSQTDSSLTAEKKMEKAQSMVCDERYQGKRTEIINEVTKSMNLLIKQTHNDQSKANHMFLDMYRKLVIDVMVFVLLIFINYLMVKKLIVSPLLKYNESVKLGETLPVIGAVELQNLAETYNTVYEENKESQKLIRHEAEYDAYGHAMGDQVLKKVALLLKNVFRSIDFVCRIGGDEFAIVMVEMTSDLVYTISEKINEINKQLLNPKDGLPMVSVSVGVAFSIRENPGESIFKDADRALYYVKEHGKHGCSFYDGKLEGM